MEHNTLSAKELRRKRWEKRRAFIEKEKEEIRREKRESKDSGVQQKGIPLKRRLALKFISDKMEVYERVYNPPKPKVKVLSEWDTIRLLIDGYSISRYGDGEVKHMDGRRNVSQTFHEDLAKALTDVFQTKRKRHLVAIPNVFNGRVFTEVDDKYIRSMHRRFGKIADRNHTYGSSYISRGDLCPLLGWPSYWSLVLEIWKDKNVVLVRGHEGRANTNMLAKCKNYENLIHVDTPPCNAWKDYDKIRRECLSHPQEFIYLLCVGPTATVLAADLADTGRQALDIGHLGLFYKRSGWGIEDPEDRQVWHHRPSDPGYIKGVTDQC